MALHSLIVSIVSIGIGLGVSLFGALNNVPLGFNIIPTHSKFYSATPSGVVAETVKKSLPQSQPQDVIAAVNAYRQENNLEAYDTNLEACDSDISEDSVFSACEGCTHAAVVNISKYGKPEQLIESLLNETTSQEILNGTKLTHMCAKEKDDTIILFFASYTQPEAVANQSQSTAKPTYKPATVTNFSEEQLWQALVDYRHAHQKPDFIKDENLCVYARKRVEEHITNFKDKPKEEYTNQDKYPLDAHAGFARDAESGEVFKITGMHEVAENLAFWPTATYPNQVIEWGWDTSTEGHREALLTDTYTHACLTGREGFYVAIFGK